MLRLRLADALDAAGMTPAFLAECSRVPTRAVMELLQPIPPKRIRLALLDRLAFVLEIHPARLLDHEPDALVCVCTAGVADSYQVDLDSRDDLRDLEDAWRREFGKGPDE